MNRKDLIAQKALEMFNERGVEAVGVREIARSLEISVGNLSYHFPKKEDILVALLARLRDLNSTAYAEFWSGPASLGAFLTLMNRVFSNQYDHRGLVVSATHIRRIQELQFDYSQIRDQRLESVRQIFTGLQASGQLQLSPEDHAAMVQYHSLFARFWIQEAFVDYSQQGKSALIDRYLHQYAYQLSLFATELGTASITDFWANFSTEKS